MLDVVLELMPEMAQEALNRPGSRFSESTDGVSLDLSGRRLQEIDVFGATLAILDALEDTIHPAGTLAAGRVK